MKLLREYTNLYVILIKHKENKMFWMELKVPELNFLRVITLWIKNPIKDNT